MDKPKRNCSAIADTEYGRVTQRFLSTALAMIAVLVAPMVCAAAPTQAIAAFPTIQPAKHTPPTVAFVRARPPRVGTGVIWPTQPEVSTTAPVGALKPRGFKK